MIEVIFIVVVIFCIIVPSRYDPAIKLKEWQERKSK